MKDKLAIYWFEPIIFIFFGIFHLHRIWAFIDRNSYSKFWISVLLEQNFLYYFIMGTLIILCVMGIITYLRHFGENYWWRWIYMFGGGYVLFDLFAIITKNKIWHNLLLNMFDVKNPYFNIIWGSFILLGLSTLVLGILILKKLCKMKKNQFLIKV